MTDINSLTKEQLIERRNLLFRKQELENQIKTQTPQEQPQEGILSPGQKAEKQRQKVNFATSEQIKQSIPTGGFQYGIPANLILNNLLATFQREEAVATEFLRHPIASLMGKNPDMILAMRGETAPQLGDIARDAGFPEPLASSVGLIASGALPSSLIGGKVLKGMGRGAKTTIKKPSGAAKALAQLLGVQQEVLDETAKIGYRQVIQKRYFNKQLPSILQEKLVSGLDKIKLTAQGLFGEATEQLKNIKIDFDSFSKEMRRFFKVSKVSPFKGPITDLNTRILNGMSNAVKNGKLTNLGDLLDTRRFLSQEINLAKRQGIDTDFVFKVKELINKYLHQNNALKMADETWTNLIDQMDSIGNKLSKDTGETMLRRFQSLPNKTKQRLFEIQRFINKQNPGGEDLIKEVLHTSLAAEFIPKTQRSTLSRGSLLERTLLPAYRFLLRTTPIMDEVNRKITDTLRPFAIPITKKVSE